MMTTEITDRGFVRTEFRDLNDNACSLQESSLATVEAIWLGVDAHRMQLTSEMVAELLQQLQTFARHGVLFRCRKCFDQVCSSCGEWRNVE